MTTEAPSSTSLADAFRARLDAVTPLLREEWPDLDAAALADCGGDVEKVVALLAKHTERTKVALRRNVEELVVVAERASRERRDANGTAKKADDARGPNVDEVVSAIRRLEAFAADEAKRVSSKVAPLAERKVRENLWVSLVFALGLGLILGLWMNGRRRP
jgi:ElaB/YqjD/DUF883 family membrane-anchored ribosome-binding protein